LTTHNSPAIIIGGGSGNGLGIARNLGRRGIPVYCVTSNPEELTCFSKYCAGYAHIPDIESNPAVMHRFLTQFQSRVGDRGVLFPTSDNALLTMTQIRPQLSHYVTYLPTQALVETMVLKSKFYQSLKQWDVPHPRTLLLDNANWSTKDLPAVYPIFIRPVQSLLFNQQFGKKGFVAQNAQELRTYLHLIQRYQLEVMLQEIIPGPTRTLYHLRGYFNHDSQPIVLLASQKLRQPTMFSDNTALVSIPLTELSGGVNMIVRYFQQIGYTGLFGADFKRDPRDGCVKLLEINARSQGGNYFGVVCGANHVLAAYRDSLGQRIQPVTKYRVGIYYFVMVQDLITLMKIAGRGQLVGQELVPFLKDRHWNVWSADDVTPFLKHVWASCCKRVGRITS
jgi:predicted ATP-grasp superfamily ATP-dependent carboligase